MTSAEQKRKAFDRHLGQDHGHRGTNRDKVTMRKALRTVQLDPEFADDPAKQKRMFKFDLENMRWSMSYDRHRDEVAHDRIRRNSVPFAGDPVEDIPSDDEIVEAHAPTDANQTLPVVHTAGTFTKPKANKQFAKRIRQVEESKQEDQNDEARLSHLYRTLSELIKELNNTPREAAGVDWVSQTDLDSRVDELEGEIESIKEEIEELEEGGKTTIPQATDAEMGLWTKKQKEAYLQHKHGDMQSDDEDDHGLDSKDNGIRAHKLPKESWY